MRKASHIRWMVLACLAITGCGMQSLEVLRVQNVTVSSWTREGLEAQWGIELENPNRFAVTVKETEVNIRVDDNDIGEVILVEPQRIKSGETALLNFQIDTYKGALGNVFRRHLIQAIMGNDIPIEIDGTVHGKAFGLTIRIPVKHTQNLNIRS